MLQRQVAVHVPSKRHRHSSSLIIPITIIRSSTLHRRLLHLPRTPSASRTHLPTRPRTSAATRDQPAAAVVRRPTPARTTHVTSVTEWNRTMTWRRIRDTSTPDTVPEWRHIRAIVVPILASTSMSKLHTIRASDTQQFSMYSNRVK